MPRWVCALSFSAATLATNSCSRRFQARPLLLELDLLGGKLLQAHDVALLLQIERGDLIAHARQILRGGERIGLRLAQGFLLLAQLLFDLPQRVLPGGERLAVLFERGLGSGQVAR